MDISERRQAEAHQRLLLHELQHRVKNTLATVGSLAARMLRTSSSIDEFSSAFLPRLTAMGRMHDLLSQHNWSGADIKALLDAALEPYAPPGDGRFVLEGPLIDLKPNMAATLGMVFHELATNAAKYGALSAPAGRLIVSWKAERTQDGDVVSLSWEEQDGPRPASGKEGFGTNFLRRSMEYELNGTAMMEFRPTGLHCRITFPLYPNDAQPGTLTGNGNTES
jgi:two-component system CheB/CheR fusion protein